MGWPHALEPWRDAKLSESMWSLEKGGIMMGFIQFLIYPSGHILFIFFVVDKLFKGIEFAYFVLNF